MNLLKLKYFVDMVNHGSVSAAARVKVVAQQSMSDHLKKLEHFYGTPLFFRTKPLTLTPAGEVLYGCAQEVLARLEQAHKEIVVLSSNQPKVLGLGLVFNDIPAFLDELLVQMRKMHGEYEVHIYDRYLNTGKVTEDAELVLSPVPLGANWAGITLLADRMAVVVRADLMETIYKDACPAVERAMKETGDLSLLDQLPFMRFTSDISPELTEVNATEPQFIDLPNTVLQAGNGMLQNAVCRNGQCAVVLPLDYAKRAFSDREDILYFPLSGEQYRRDCNIYYRTGKPLSPPAVAFIELAQKLFSNRT